MSAPRADAMTSLGEVVATARVSKNEEIAVYCRRRSGGRRVYQVVALVRGVAFTFVKLGGDVSRLRAAMQAIATALESSPPRRPRTPKKTRCAGHTATVR
jgi:hypothetical protein